MLQRRLQLLACLTVAALRLSAALAQQPPTLDEIVRLAKAGEAADKDFSGAVAAGLTLARCSLAGTNWRGADLRGAMLTAVSLQKADLRQANLRGAVLERVDLLNADLSGADLSGAILCLTNLENANLTGCRMDGVTLEGTGLSLTGAPYLAALHLALQNASTQQFSRAWVAGLSGDAFAFSYSTDPQPPTRDQGFWPGLPFSVNPFQAAADNLGLRITFARETAAEKLLLDKLQEQSVFVLPLKPPTVDERLTQGRPLWAVLTARETREAGMVFVFQAPPYGSQEFRREQLFGDIWGGPWDTPEPAGKMTPARRQLVALGCGVPLPASDQVAKALRQAAAIITEKRTYGPLVPGEAGLTRLAADLRDASTSLDSEAARRLLAWQRFPRHCLIGSLGLACDFLGEAALVLPDDKQQACQEARLLLRSTLTALDANWPQLTAPGEALTPAQAAAFARAADIVAEVAAAERKAATLFATIAR
ncbi:pentapeptide repeat-containing protein [bacterium]|nr:pentapeptide repeat-containing protein [bacterium]